METYSSIANKYRQEINESNLILTKTRQEIHWLGTAKFILFLLIIGCIIYSIHNLALQVIIGISVILFFVLMRIQSKRIRRKEYLEVKITALTQELEALDNNFSSFDAGQEFINPSHDYSFDLDLFGEHSLFQCCNRTTTCMGKRILSEWIAKQETNKESIEERQKTISEISKKDKFRTEFRIAGLLHKEAAQDADILSAWIADKKRISRSKFVKIIPASVLISNSIWITLTALGYISADILGMIITGWTLLSFYFTSKISKIQNNYGKSLAILRGYLRMIKLTEECDFMSANAIDLQAVFDRKGVKASNRIIQLTKRMNSLDKRNNVFMLVILNGLFFWELWLYLRVERWKEENGNYLESWMNAIGKMDAYVSLGTFAFNHPDYTYPTITNSSFCLECKELGHPLMRKEICVKNNMEMRGEAQFNIITGANMAGKSTYLRTIGINIILACMGLPVCAEEMKLTPIRLITSLRTSDSLNANESYFFAELKRIKRIIDLLQSGAKMFIILDEILKGTNSVDKQKGSMALIKQFIGSETNGIIATHDIMLGEMIKSYPKHIKNYCFDATIKDKELLFTYKMKEGVAHNMNACFLMKQMGIAIE